MTRTQMIPTALPPTWLGALMDSAIDGIAGLPGATKTAATQLSRTLDHEKAITALTRSHIAASGAQGFVTNIGGLITMPVAAPANLVGIAVINIRLAATIAHLRGYDVQDPRVRTAIAMCLLGPRELTRQQETGDLPAIQTVATAPIYDPSLLIGVHNRISSIILGRIGGKQLIGGLLKRIPVAGGAVGAGTDGWVTFEVGKLARKSFVNRRFPTVK